MHNLIIIPKIFVCIYQNNMLFRSIDIRYNNLRTMDESKN